MTARTAIRGRPESVRPDDATRPPWRPRVWWVHPAGVILPVAALSLIPAMMIGDTEFRLLWHSPKTLTTTTALIFACGALTLALTSMIGAALPGGTGPPRGPLFSAETITLLHRSSSILLWLTLFGYAGFGILAVRAGVTPTELLAGRTTGGTGLKDVIGTLPGVTTLTQCGVAVVVISALSLIEQPSRSAILKIVTVVALATGRAYVRSERLAVLELVVPLVVIWACRLDARRGARRVLARLAPIAALPLLISVFGLFEYFRSWTFYRSQTDRGFGTFVVDRIAGYYATSINNGAILYEHSRWPQRIPYDSIEGVWTAPGVAQLDLYSGLTEPQANPSPGPDGYDTLLGIYGNAEFNNPSGYTGPFTDFGFLGGITYFAVMGLIVGVAYRSFCNGRLLGMMAYPIIFIGLLEMPRYLYWVQGRATPIWVSIAAVAAVAAWHHRYRPPARPRAPAHRDSGP
ncbi:O-antigen polymerase [Gordonia sp. NPDC003376]